MRRPIQALLIAASLLSSQAMAGPQEDQRARNAVRVLAEIQEIPEQGIPDKLLDEGRAVIVIPDTIKAGLVIGGRRGHGLMSVRMPNGAWSSPVFVKLTGGSIGFQAGVQSSDVVLVFRNDRSLDNLVNGNSPSVPMPALPPARWPQCRGGHRRPAEGRDLVVVARPRPVRRCRPGWRGAADRRCRQPGGLRQQHHAADDLRRAGCRFAVDGCGRLPRSPGGGHLRRAQQPQRHGWHCAASGPGGGSCACSGSPCGPGRSDHCAAAERAADAAAAAAGFQPVNDGEIRTETLGGNDFRHARRLTAGALCSTA